MARNKNKNEMFVSAASMGDSRRLNLLLEKGADAATNNSEALFWAASRGDIEMAEILINAGARADAVNSRALDAAIEAKNPKLTRMLLSAGADPRNRDEGLTTMMKALFNGGSEVMSELLATGAFSLKECEVMLSKVISSETPPGAQTMKAWVERESLSQEAHSGKTSNRKHSL